VFPRKFIATVPENRRTGGVEEPSFWIKGAVEGLRCAPAGERRRLLASLFTRDGSRYTPPRRWRRFDTVATAAIRFCQLF